MDKRQFWYFSKEKDIEQTADDPTSGRPAQPDHFPNVVRPGGGYPEGRGEKTDAFCNKCKDQLIDGSCLRCDWGPQNRSVPVENFPLDPFEDDKAGIRASSWNFKESARFTKEEKEKLFEILKKIEMESGKNKDVVEYSPMEVAKAFTKATGREVTRGVINNFVKQYKENFKPVSVRSVNWTAPIQYNNQIYTKNDLAKYLCELKGDQFQSDAQIAKLLGVHESTLSRYYKDLKNGIQRVKDPRRTDYNLKFEKIKQPLLEELNSLINQYKSDPENVQKMDYAKYLNTLGEEKVHHKRAALQRYLKKVINDNGLLSPEELKDFDNKCLDPNTGKIERTEDNYVYFIQSPTSAKIGWSGHLPRRWAEHSKGNEERDKSRKQVTNEMIYNLDESYTNDAPGAVIVGPIKDWKVAQWTESVIKRWFASLGWEKLTENIHKGGFSEAIFNTEGDTGGGRFPVEAMSQFMERFIEDTAANGGSLPEYTEEQKQEFASMFNYDPDITNKFFGEGSVLAELRPEEMAPASTALAVPDKVVIDPNLAPMPNPSAEEPVEPVYQKPVSPYAEAINATGRQQEIANMLQNGLAYQDEQGNIIDVKTDQIISKTADYQGWTNWPTDWA
jgi:predicted transcriptional regulator